MAVKASRIKLEVYSSGSSIYTGDYLPIKEIEKRYREQVEQLSFLDLEEKQNVRGKRERGRKRDLGAT